MNGEPTDVSAAVRETAAEDPDRLALDTGTERVGYAELNGDADAVAARLLNQLGPGPHRIAVRTASTRAVATAALGILRAGMVLVPVDHTAPDAYAQTILKDVGAVCLLGDPDGPSLGVDLIDPLAQEPVAGEAVDAPLDALWSIAFTSGSTGVPKGIMLPRAQLPTPQSAAVWVSEGASRLRGGVIANGTAAPVAGVMLQYLAAGATIAAYELERDGVHGIGAWLAESDINGIALVPTLLREILAATPPSLRFSGLRVAAVYGETITWEDAAALRAHLPDATPLFNTFGLTETSGFAVFAVMADTQIGSGPLPIGWPLPGRTVHLLDPDGQPVPDGEAGEIIVDSATNALGYWNRPELTASVFTELPGGLRRVATGDRGRRRDDGVLEHLGRLDHLVKVAGHRIELAHVERALRDLPTVADAAASTYVDQAGDTRLRAHVVVDGDRAPDSAMLRDELAQRLPGRMLPDWIEVIDQLPRLGSGKVDRLALPPQRTELRTGEPTLESSRPLESELQAIWSEVLGVRDIGVDNTFLSLGGDSLRAARVFAEIERQLGIVQSPSLLLRAKTIRTLAAALRADPSSHNRCLVPIRPDGDRPPLFAVHALDGGVWWAAGLADGLGPRQPVYGIEAAWFDGTHDPQLTLSEIAARYVRELTSVNPDGPVLIYGYSSGGVIAFEMASLLEHAGRDVALLAFGDTVVPGIVEPTPPGPPRSTAQVLRGWLRHDVPRYWWLVRLRGQFAADRLRTRWIRLTGPPRSRAGLQPALERQIGLCLHRHRLMTKVSAEALLLRQRGLWGSWDRGWQEYLTAPLSVVELDGDHHAQIAPHRLPELAARLSEAIDARLAARSLAV